MRTNHIREENRVQAEAFRRLRGDEIGLIECYAADFRNIITDFKIRFGRVPTADDLIWIESERNGRDITQS